jgi:hypothetical protein
LSDPQVDTPIPVSNVPKGLTALAIPRADGTLPRDRKGRVKVTQVRLSARRPDGLPHPGEAVEGVADEDLRWAIAKQRRRWASIAQRLGSAAQDQAMRLAAAGVVDLVCTVDELVQIDAIRHWQRTTAWEEYQRTEDLQRADDTNLWQTRAHDVARRVGTADPGLAEALITTRPNNPRLPVLVHAAEDLVAGVVHDGPRAFSQAHFGDTKARDEAPKILAEAGVLSETLVALGLRRSPHVGLGGPINIRIDSGVVDLSVLDGPVRFRVDQHGTFDVHLNTNVWLLAVVENLQAAETICDIAPDIALLWCAGQPSKPALQLIGDLSAEASSVLVATDADLGGVRIARRILNSLPPHVDVMVLDAGTGEHPTREPFGKFSREGLLDASNDSGPIATFARACLDRGYPVEQEGTIRRTLRTFLGASKRSSPGAPRALS